VAFLTGRTHRPRIPHQTFNAASQAFYSALSFQSLQGPNSLSGITESQIMPTYLYNSVDRPLDPHSGKYLYAALGFSGLGGNVNTIRPVLEGKYFRPVNKRRNVVGLHLLASTIRGYGGKVPPPFSRFYLGASRTFADSTSARSALLRGSPRPLPFAIGTRQGTSSRL
jgi:outer membrane protein insertion porin family